MGNCQNSLPKTPKPVKRELKEKLATTIIIFTIGGPGCGKGSQSIRMAQKYNFTHLAIGDLLREEAIRPTSRAKSIRDIMLNGALVPSSAEVKQLAICPIDDFHSDGKLPINKMKYHSDVGFIIDLLMDKLQKAENVKGFIIESFPREINQAKLFEELAGRPPNMVIVFDCSTETMIQRLLIRSQRGERVDDHESIIRQRLETHYTQCEPILAHYLQKGILRNVIGEEPPEVVFDKCCSVVDDVLKGATSKA